MTTQIRNIACILIIIAVFCVGCEPEPVAKTQPESAELVPETEAVELFPAAEPEASEETETVEPAIEAKTEAKATEEIVEELADNPIAVTVNGTDITENQIEGQIKLQIDRMTAQGAPQDYINSMKTQLRQQILDGLIIEHLIDAEVAKANIVVTEEDINDQIQQIAASQKLSLDDLKALIEAQGSTFEQWKEQMQFPKRLGLVKLMETQMTSDTNVADEQAIQYYDQNKASFETPETARASHILIKPDTSDPNKDPNQADAEALAKAQQLLEELKNGADFAELAKANSGCPSSAKGGDLNFFSRGQMVPAFDKAAFELEPGQISDIVKTRYGYHIIKVTDHKEASVTPFEQAKEEIIAQLQQEKARKIFGDYIESLKQKAQIVYPVGKEPQPMLTPGMPMHR